MVASEESSSRLSSHWMNRAATRQVVSRLDLEQKVIPSTAFALLLYHSLDITTPTHPPTPTPPPRDQQQ